MKLTYSKIEIKNKRENPDLLTLKRGDRGKGRCVREGKGGDGREGYVPPVISHPQHGLALLCCLSIQSPLPSSTTGRLLISSLPTSTPSLSLIIIIIIIIIILKHV